MAWWRHAAGRAVLRRSRQDWGHGEGGAQEDGALEHRALLSIARVESAPGAAAESYHGKAAGTQESWTELGALVLVGRLAQHVARSGAWPEWCSGVLWHRRAGAGLGVGQGHPVA